MTCCNVGVLIRYQVQIDTGSLPHSMYLHSLSRVIMATTWQQTTTSVFKEGKRKLRTTQHKVLCSELTLSLLRLKRGGDN